MTININVSLSGWSEEGVDEFFLTCFNNTDAVSFNCLTIHGDEEEEPLINQYRLAYDVNVINCIAYREEDTVRANLTMNLDEFPKEWFQLLIDKINRDEYWKWDPLKLKIVYQNQATEFLGYMFWEAEKESSNVTVNSIDFESTLGYSYPGDSETYDEENNAALEQFWAAWDNFVSIKESEYYG